MKLENRKTKSFPRSLGRRVILLTCCIYLPVALLAFIAWGWADSQSPAGQAYFRLGYTCRGPQFLGSYAEYLAKRSSGMIPPVVNDFLARRMLSHQGTAESEAILDFYLGMPDAALSESCQADDGELGEAVMAAVLQSRKPVDFEKAYLMESLRISRRSIAMLCTQPLPPGSPQPADLPLGREMLPLI